MGKLLINLNKQLKTDRNQDAEDCLIIYNKLKQMHDGRVWESDWNPLVSTTFEGFNTKIYQPTAIGRIFLKGLHYKQTNQ